MKPDPSITTAVASACCFVSSAVALYLPAIHSPTGGSVNAFSSGNGIQAIWGPNGYSTTSFGPGFSSQMQGQFGLNGGALSNSVSRVQVFPAAPGIIAPFI
ncbi:hypothetical protein GGI25_003101 [Coemansia spiralis]|uniref:Uncharacterized protein n=2 Tax=Coemansia TaxID=4863 RepID=A0A9W8G2Q1_9FUNG|nr:hypothetical protein BX070DRAFT_229180 [Coemansia spiralis]KAJ1994551.1 hypothetical protein EDC05_001467 [Coemansia umbellata]KAJ2624357.1 hypothetical protein GGI26_001491 [Coemansia sp. RSA 1358]KAJ2677581.1 hypothetical protein GGI25_003101 [Coemansia spiralis]